MCACVCILKDNYSTCGNHGKQCHYHNKLTVKSDVPDTLPKV